MPAPTPITAPYWDAARQHRLSIQRCRACRTHQDYPRSRCATCWSDAVEMIDASGRGTVYSFTIARVPTHPGLAGQTPYVIAIVQLDEGPRMTTNIVGCAPEAVRVGMAVEVEFVDVDARVTLVAFRPVAVDAD